MSTLVYITGASSGIGQALAARYARAGARLALVARRGDLLREWADRQGLGPDRCRVWAADVADRGAIADAGRACMEEFGLPDVVIANAGISIGMDTAVRADLDMMAQLYAVNVLGVAATFHPFIDPMRRRGSGTLVGMASVAAARGVAWHGAYCSSKAAVASYCESLRGELRPANVKVVTLSPGWVATPLTARNPYPMPFLLQPEAFAERAYRAIEAGASHRYIPWQMGWVARLLKVLPNAAFDRLLAGRPRKPRRTVP